MYVIISCTVALFALVYCNDNNIRQPDQHSMQCDQNDDVYNPNPVQVHTRQKRAVSSEPGRLWPYGIIPYVMEPGIPDAIILTLKESMDHWSHSTCIRFTRRTNEEHYISFYNGINCCSWVGRLGGEQRVSVGTRCSTFGVLVHELGHVIGFWHEHSRPDRDYYIKVISENLQRGAVRNFEKLPSSKVNSFGKLYDYESVMHYGPRHFSTNWKNTIETRLARAQEYIGQRSSLSEGDIEQANILYSCPSHMQACSTMIRSSAGRVTSPRYPRKYGASLNCITIIQPDQHGYVLVARVLDLQIADSQDCVLDYLEIRDGPTINSKLLVRLCGKKDVQAIVSGTGTLRLQFMTDGTSAGRGFLLEFETKDVDECVLDNGGCSHFCTNTIGSFTCSCPPHMTLSERGVYCIDNDIRGTCSGILTSPTGVISSMGYPHSYIGGLSCFWMIYPPKSLQIELTFRDFDLEYTPDQGEPDADCLYDYVEISDNSHVESRRYCGKTLPDTITVNSSRLSVRFNSDATITGRGFFATYRAISKEPECIEHLNSVSGSLIYNRMDKSVDLCTYIISLPTSFHITYKYKGRISDGTVGMGTSHKQLTSYSGYTSGSKIKTLTNLLKVVINTTSLDSAFSLSWTSRDKDVCGASLRASRKAEDIFSHHTYGNTTIPPYQTCKWSIVTSPQHQILLTFLAFQLGLPGRSPPKCNKTYLEVRENNRRIGRYCGGLPLTIVSKRNNLELRLVTKMAPGKGFHIKYSRLT